MTRDVGDPEVTKLLRLATIGDADAFSRLLPLVYEEMRKVAVRQMQRERDDHTLQPTALVHEAYLRLVNQRHPNYRDRHHFYSIAGRVIRQILVDYARTKTRLKRGGEYSQVALTDHLLEDTGDGATLSSEQLLAVHDALERLAAKHERASRVVEMRFFAGLLVEEVADVLDVSERTVRNDWSYARAWLKRELEDASDEEHA